MDLSLRYAHCEGHTEVVSDRSGKYLITCGTDGDVRIFDGFDDDDPKTHHMGETVNTLHLKNGKVYVPTDSNAVVAYTFPDIAFDGVILQFFTSVYHITSNLSGKLLAAGGGDFTIKVYDNDAKNFSVCRGHDAPILSLAFDPDDKYLASSSCDGTVRIWQLSDFSCVKTLNVIKKSNDFCRSETLCRLQWYPVNGKFLAVPVQQEIRFYDRESWICNIIFHEESLSIIKVLSVTTFSPCGLYIAAGSSDGTILVWDVKTKKLVGMKKHSKSISVCSLIWNPSGKKDIFYCDVEGQLGLFDNIFESLSADDETARTDSFHVAPDGDEDGDFVIGHSNRCETALKSTPLAEDDDDDGDNAFDIGALKAEFEPKIFGEIDAVDDVLKTTEHVEEKSKPVEVVTTPLQTSFQPGSTPLHLEHRFMIWNNVGIARSYNTDEENSIDVEFHDASICHPIHINNIHNFTMASLSSEALLLASSKADDAVSKLQCHHFATWDSHKEWTIEMAKDEDIEAVALGTGWVAAGTDKRLIRVFTISGIQLEVFCVPGPIVCLAGFENQLSIAYHQGPGILGEQNLGLLHVNINLKAQCVCKKYDLPITSKSFLTWMGFTDEGQLSTVDTAGVIRMLSIQGLAKWIAIADTKNNVKGKSDNYFVIGLSEIQQEIRCILCKGSRYPSILPRPAVTSIPFSLPFCEMTTDKGRLEEVRGRSSMLHHRVKSLLSSGFDLDSELASCEKKLCDVLLRIFALATQSGHEFRAMDIAELMPNSRVIQGAIKYATQKHHMKLAERLGEVVRRKIMDESSVSEAVYEEEEEIFQQVPANYAKFNGFSSKAEEKIKPKPLIRRSRSFRKTEDQRNELAQPENPPQNDDDGISLLPASNPVINPFKVQKPSSSNDRANTSGIDDVLFESAHRHSSKGILNSTSNEKMVAKQSKLFETKQRLENSSSVQITPKKFGFTLFLEEKKGELQEENPTMEDSGIVKLAAKMFKELPDEEKEKYKSKPKGSKTFSEGSNKRKIDIESNDGDETESLEVKKSKKKTESNTRNNFSLFAFVKKAS